LENQIIKIGRLLKNCTKDSLRSLKHGASLVN